MAPEEQTPPLCANNCGFFGSAANGNLCSKCYRLMLIQRSLAAIRNVPGHHAASSSDSSTSLAPASPPPAALTATIAAPMAKGGRCVACNKKVGLLKGFFCRCGNVYCTRHRYPEEHACEFDFKAAERDAIARNNPIVRASKLEKF